MSETKFTKGPWKFNGYDGSITDCTKAENEIAIVQLDDWTNIGMAIANAHLMKAAPKMYALLESILENTSNIGGEDWFCDEVRELLAEARGEQS